MSVAKRKNLGGLTVAKKQICVIFGGVSSEHEVSCMSVKFILNSLDREKYQIHMLAISKCGKWFYYDDEIERITEGHFSKRGFDRAMISPDRGDKCILRFRGETVERIAIDAAIPVLHGKNGEDGTIQGLLELAGIPYVGSKVTGSAVCMDKCIAKIVFRHMGIPQADWVERKIGDPLCPEEIEEKIGYPCFVKPSNAGSSVGVSKASNRVELEQAVQTAFAEDYKLLVEPMIDCREVECSVLGNLAPVTADVLGEIAPAKDFYDYEAKYQDENSRLMIPAPLPKETVEKIKEYAILAYRACECRGLARVDFFVERTTGEIYLNEINTLPGFTSISMYPKLWAASGVECGELLDRFIALAEE